MPTPARRSSRPHDAPRAQACLPARTRPGAHAGVVALGLVLSLVLTLGGATTPPPAEAAPQGPVAEAPVAAGAVPSVPPVVDVPRDGLTADALPTAQVDGVVWDQAVVGTTVYAVGEFTSARPAGSAPGQGESPRWNMLAYDLVSGQLTAWAPVVNGRIRVVTASPDGRILYIGGSFTQVDGQRRSRIAAFTTADGRLTPFAPVASSDVFAVAATDSVVYLGGWLNAVNGVPRSRLAAVSAQTGAVLDWAPAADHTVYALGLTGAGDRLVAGGSFSTLNGQASPSMGSLDATTGAAYPFAIAGQLRNVGNSAAMYSVNVVGERAYASAFSYGSGNFEGVMVVDARTGLASNVVDCHGDSYDAVPFRGTVHVVSHHHHCQNVGGFPEEVPARLYRANAFTEDARGTVARNTQPAAGYGNWEGHPAGSPVSWYPDLTIGTATGSGQAAWTVETAGEYLLAGGEFTAVNGVPQQGLVRFATRAVVGRPASGPVGAPADLTPTLQPRTSTSVSGSFPTVWDRDGLSLTYRVLRDDRGEGAPVATLRSESTPWSRPRLTFVDSDVVPGWRYTYRVVAADADGNTLAGDAVTVTAAESGLQRGYAGAVLADEPTHYWRLGQAAGATTAPDAMSTAVLSLGSGVVGGQAGALDQDSDAATAFSGASTARAASRDAEAAPETFSLELWFRTSSGRGGKLLGVGDAASGLSGRHDRNLYLDEAGRLVFGVESAGIPRVVSSAPGLADGAWHHGVGTVGAGGLVLYVDGVEVARDPAVTSAGAFTGHWRVGGDALGPAWPGRVVSTDVDAVIDEVAIYAAPLTAERVTAHHAAGRTRPPEGAGPTAHFATTTTALTVTFDARGSTAAGPGGAGGAEPTPAVLAWDFGDGRRGTGSTPQHTYAAPGTYPVSLTVVDAVGRVARATHAVTVGAADDATVALDAFDRTGAEWGAAAVGGPWAVWGGSGAAVEQGHGVLRLAAGQTASATLPSVAADDVDARAEFVVRPDAGAAVGAAWEHHVLARTAPHASHRLVTRVEPDGSLRVTVNRVVQGVTSRLASTVVPGVTVAPGDRLTARFRVIGTNPVRLAGSVWAGAEEPAAWHVTATDTQPGWGRGGVGVLGWASSRATGPVTLAVDRFEARVPGPNALPRAVFAATTDGLAVTVDAAGSRDPDGAIASYAWEFGDGSVATGETATHRYAGAGVRTVRLTVTDERGGSATTSLPVTVAAPVSVLAADDFGRTLAGDWGRITPGGAWRLSAPEVFGVDGQVGTVALPTAGVTRAATLPEVMARDVSVSTAWSIDRVPVGDSYYHQLLTRMNGPDAYTCSVRILPDGRAHLILARKVGGAETVLRTAPWGTNRLAAGEQVRLRCDAVGDATSVLRAKIWRATDPEPATWQAVATEATPSTLRASGAVGLRFHPAGGMTSVPLTVTVDSFRVEAP